MTMLITIFIFLSFFSVKYKACRGMWKFSQHFRKKYSHKNNAKIKYVYARSYVCMQAKISHNSLVFRKAKCLLLLRKLAMFTLTALFMVRL